jgi:hypothetical protein
MSLRIAATAVLAALLATCAGDDLARAAAEAGRPGAASPRGVEPAARALVPRAPGAMPSTRISTAAPFATDF